jgi:drug/metabolite transporter (DMT)-like permease
VRPALPWYWCWKLGATATITLALSLRQSFPPVGPAAALLVVGATGYGLSLRLYLLAQREFGAARTGSVFAFAPFLGAVLSVLISGHFPGWGLVAGGILMLVGVVLHLTETNTQGPGRSTRIAADSPK